MSKNKHGTISFGKGDKRIVLFHMNKPIGGGVIGMVKSKILPMPVAVVIDETPADKRDYEFACLACAENGIAPRILLERELYYDIMRGSTEARVILLHELGHYYHQHLLQKVADRDNVRNTWALSGYTDPNEIEADMFAASYLGAERTATGLLALVNRIQSHADAESSQLAVQELHWRISALQSKNPAQK